MYLRVIPYGGGRVGVAKDELGVFKELKSLAFVPHTMTVEEYLQQIAHDIWITYGVGIHITGNTPAEKAQSAYRQFVDKGFLIELTKEEALEEVGWTQGEADELNLEGLRSIDK